MPNLLNAAVPAAGTYTGSIFQIRQGPMQAGAPMSLCAQKLFTYGSGGTTVDTFLQTSLDGGNTWADVIRWPQSTTASDARPIAGAASSLTTSPQAVGAGTSDGSIGTLAANSTWTTGTTITMGVVNPGWVLPGMSVFDTTAAAAIGTVLSYTGLTLTLTAAAAHASSGSTDALLFGGGVIIVPGLFAHWWRVKYIVAGTYATSTLRVDVDCGNMVPAGAGSFN